MALKKCEFGDFQTPLALARQVVDLLARRGLRPAAVVEPTCGVGAFLRAALERFPEARFVGADLNEAYLGELADVASERVELLHADFFRHDWMRTLAGLPGPVLLLGNPPWITNSDLGQLGSRNLPKKASQASVRGIEALTGKSNFDISEWMLLRYLEWLDAKPGTLAVLCKSKVARKILEDRWRRHRPVEGCALYGIDAAGHFGVAVDACLFVMTVGTGPGERVCPVYASLEDEAPATTIGFCDGLLVNDAGAYAKWRRLRGMGQEWRSGVKHDCSAVMELEVTPDGLRNGLGERVDLEPTCLYPLLKSSDLANGRPPRKRLLVTQTSTGQETDSLRTRAPRTWRYLEEHEPRLSARASSIYRNRPRFSLFGVGPYTFTPWKVAISSLYKRLAFEAVGPWEGRPVVFDDTACLLACDGEAEARLLHRLLTSEPAREFYGAMINWSDKRPITVEILRRLDLRAVAAELGLSSEYEASASERSAREGLLDLV